MANRRMFSKQITDSDRFVDMPLSSQALYFHLGIWADDDWFISPQRVMRGINANKNDLDVLIAKWFCIMFEDGVIVITHRKTNNYLRPDRYAPTIYQEHLKKLNLEGERYQWYTSGIPNVLPLVGAGKDSIGKDSKVKDNKLLEWPDWIIQIYERCWFAPLDSLAYEHKLKLLGERAVLEGYFIQGDWGLQQVGTDDGGHPIYSTVQSKLPDWKKIQLKVLDFEVRLPKAKREVKDFWSTMYKFLSPSKFV